MTTKARMTKKDAHALAAELGLQVEATATAEQVVEEIRDAVDEADQIVAGGSGEDDCEGAEALLNRAAEAGILPRLESEVKVDQPGADGDTEDEALKDAESEAVDAAEAEPAEVVEGEVVEGEVVEGEVVDAPLNEGQAEEMALAIRETQHGVQMNPAIAPPAMQEFNAVMGMAARLANSRIVPREYQGRPDDVFAAYMFGKALGLDIMTALRDLYIIEGRAAIAAHRLLGLMRARGVRILSSDATAEEAWIIGKRMDTGEEMRVEFTMDEARKIVRKGKSLVSGDNWQNYPKDMLWARAVGRLARRLAPDLIGGSTPPYTADEVADFEGWDVAYDESGNLQASQAAQRQAPAVPEYRKEYPDYNWPQSLAEIRDRLGLILGPEEALEWLAQARVAMFPDADPAAATKEQKDILFQALSTVLAEFEVGARAKVQAVFAKRLGGAVLEGPPWSLGPDEAEARPAKVEVVGADRPAAKAPPSAAAEGGEPAEPLEGGESYYAQFDDVDDIPFGPTDSSTS
jgi:hypothetical protein